MPSTRTNGTSCSHGLLPSGADAIATMSPEYETFMNSCMNSWLGLFGAGLLPGGRCSPVECYPETFKPPKRYTFPNPAEGVKVKAQVMQRVKGRGVHLLRH